MTFSPTTANEQKLLLTVYEMAYELWPDHTRAMTCGQWAVARYNRSRIWGKRRTYLGDWPWSR